MRFDERLVGVALLAAAFGIVEQSAWSQMPQTRPADAPTGAAPADEARWFRNVRQLTTTALGLDRAGEAYFSPDGKRISFQAYPAGQQDYQIYVINFDGTGLKMISTGRGACTCSFWHPSGEKIIFAANHDDLRPAVSPDESQPQRPRGDAAASQPGSRPASGGAQHGGGQGYAWKYYPGMEVYEYTLATGQLKRLTNSDGYDAECAYSPDGQHIVFASRRDGDEEIYICDADGQNPRRITHAHGPDGGPFFSPDGRRIVYRSDRAGNGNLQIFVNNIDGTDEHAITDSESFHWCPFWHPSGKWLIYTHTDFRGRPNFDLYLIRDDGSAEYRVTTDPAADVLPAFSPDGRYLMWTSRRSGLEQPQIFIAEFVGLTPSGELRAVEP